MTQPPPPPLPPASLPALADADFERLDDARLLELQGKLAMAGGQHFSIQVPRQYDPARHHDLPVLMARRVYEHRNWDVRGPLNVVVAISDSVTGKTGFHFPFAADKPLLPSGMSRYGPEPEQPWEDSATAQVLLLPVPLGDAAAGGRTIATRAIYFDWKTPPAYTVLAGPAAPVQAEAPTTADWLKVETQAPAGLEPGNAPAMRLHRLPNGVLVASGRLAGSAGHRTASATLLLLRKDQTTAHTRHFALTLNEAGSAWFMVNLGAALGAGSKQAERIYLFTGPEALGPFDPEHP